MLSTRDDLGARSINPAKLSELLSVFFHLFYIPRPWLHSVQTSAVGVFFGSLSSYTMLELQLRAGVADHKSDQNTHIYKLAHVKTSGGNLHRSC